MEPREAERLRRTVREFLEGGGVSGVVALCAYGSHVAGYARKDSDHDVLAVIDGYGKVRYHYFERGGLAVALLAVDKELFEGDIKEGKLGEFVAGRLLVPQLPLEGEPYLRRADTEYKKRVVLEELGALVREFGPMALELEVELKYLLMARLKRRISYYPPVKYSYVKTFFGKRGEANTSLILDSLKRAARELANEGLVDFADGCVRISPRLAEAPPPGVDWVTYVKRVLLSYYTHSRAGRVGPSVVLKEAASKLRRARQVVRIPDELAQPASLLRLSEGAKLLVRTRGPRDLLAAALGKEPSHVSARTVAWPVSEVKLVEAEVDGRVEKLVVKRYGLLSTAKWLLVTNFVKPRAAFMPKERLSNEYFFNRTLSRLGYNVPRIRAVSWDKAVVVADFIEGRGLQDIVAESGVDEAAEAAAKVGRLLAKLHSDGLSLRDARAENFLVDGDGEVWVVDLEQATRAADPSLDLAVFLFFRPFAYAGLEGEVEIAKAFVRGYLETGSKEVVEKAISRRMLALFAAVTPPAQLLSVAQACATEISRPRS